MPKVESEKRSEKEKSNGWGGGQLFGTESNENTFQGAGFKDKEKAQETIRLLTGRDWTYQYQIINSMYNRAKVILRRTTDKEKRTNLSESIDTFEAWIDDYKAKGRAKETFAYLPIDLIESYKPLADHYELEDNGFLKAYSEVEGDLKGLRNKKVPEKDITWDIERNEMLRPIATKIKEEFITLYETDGDMRGLPSKDHVSMIMWGYSGDMSKLKKSLPLLKEKLESKE